MCRVLRREGRKRGMAGWWVGFRGATTNKILSTLEWCNRSIHRAQLHSIGSEAYWKSRIGGRKGEGGLTPGLSRRDRLNLSSTTDNYATPLITRYQVKSVDEIKERGTPLDRQIFFSLEIWFAIRVIFLVFHPSIQANNRLCPITKCRTMTFESAAGLVKKKKKEKKSERGGENRGEARNRGYKWIVA